MDADVPLDIGQVCGTNRICAINDWNFVYFESLPLRRGFDFYGKFESRQIWRSGPLSATSADCHRIATGMFLLRSH
jgi:hypothetical protein